MHWLTSWNQSCHTSTPQQRSLPQPCSLYKHTILRRLTWRCHSGCESGLNDLISAALSHQEPCLHDSLRGPGGVMGLSCAIRSTQGPSVIHMASPMPLLASSSSSSMALATTNPLQQSCIVGAVG